MESRLQGWISRVQGDKQALVVVCLTACYGIEQQLEATVAFGSGPELPTPFVLAVCRVPIADFGGDFVAGLSNGTRPLRDDDHLFVIWVVGVTVGYACVGCAKVDLIGKKINK